MDTIKTSSFTYDSAVGFDTFVVLCAINSSDMTGYLAIPSWFT
jgi:hypothetical protein